MDKQAHAQDAHTPLPWVYNGAQIVGARGKGRYGKVVANPAQANYLNVGRMHADMKLIVSWVNSHDGLVNALRTFVDAYRKQAEPIGDSDLYDEQPRSVHVTLGDCRKAERVLREAEQQGAKE